MFNFLFVADGTGTGLPRIQPSEVVRDIQAKAAQEIMNFRHPAAFPTEGDSVARLAETGRGSMHPGPVSSGSNVSAPSSMQVSDTPGLTNQGFSGFSGGISSSINKDDNLNDILDTLESMSDGGKPSEVWYELKCERPGCSWKTLKSNDPMAIAGLTLQLDLHLRDQHQQEGRGASMNAAHRSFVDATKKVVYAEGMDNRSSILHPVRMIPGVLDHRVGAKVSPLYHDQIFCQIDFSHFGVIIRNFKVIAILHNRTSQALKLQMLTPNYLQMREDDPRKSKELKSGDHDDLLTNMENLGECVLAVENYDLIASYLHPLDYGPKCLKRVILEKVTKGQVSEVADVILFFNSIVNENACRIARRDLPLEHSELLVKWDHIVGVSLPSTHSAVKETKELAATVSSLQREFNNYKSQTMKRPIQSGKRDSKRPRGVASGGYCLEFNSRKGCSNPPSAVGCSKNGRDMKHGCTFTVSGGGFCNEMSHNKYNHV